MGLLGTIDQRSRRLGVYRLKLTNSATFKQPLLPPLLSLKLRQ